MSALLRSGLAVAALLFSAAAGAQTLACNPSSPRTDPGAGFIAFGANEQLLARGGNSGPAWEWAVGPDTEGAEKAKGSLDWVSGKVYGWTLSYAASGAGSLEIRDGAALVLSLAYPSGMDRGNALEMRVSTNASIGPGTTIGAAASAINGKSVSGGVSQTGNNLESAQSLYFYYPPMSQGLTASGTVSLTYASLPTGGRVQVTVRSGNVPCTNQAPSVSLVAPAEGTLHQAGSLISVTANAADADGTVAAVEFLANGAPIGSDTAAPFSVTWTPAAGIYSLTARASDNAGDETLSAPVSITVNAQPTVSITAPASGSVVQAPGSVTLTASAADTDGTVTKVDFYQGATLVGTATAAPYSATVSNLASGSYPFTALATDDRGGSATSAAVSVRVNAAPTVSLTSPANGAVYNAPASLTLAASAGDADGSIAKMDFYQGTTLVGTANSAPASVTLSNQPAGTYSFTAVALDSDGQQTTSAAVSVTVNALPTVSLTSPSNNATFNAPASISLTAQVTDTDGSIASVEFYYGATLIATRTAPPYSFTWTGVPQGVYSLTARATDNAGATAVSAAVNVTVNQAIGQLYFIHADHLNTPRLVADATGTTVWRWDQQEPFGVNVPDENPSGLGAFDLPLRLPGQYFDKETNLHYNMARDYAPEIGRYVESDPIGLKGGLNTYAYAALDPLRWSDATGLAVWQCLRRIHGFPIANHTYLFDDKTSRCCGDTGPGAKDPLRTCKEAGPRSDTCILISSSDSDADKLLNCCNTKTNKQVYFPVWNDCQDVVDDCIREIGMAPPESKSTNRWKRCASCWIR